MYTRRTFIVTTGSAATVAALSGCLDDEEEPETENDADDPQDDDPTDDETQDDDSEDRDDEPSEHTFGVDRFVYTTSRVRDYGNYTPQPDDTYAGGEMVWLYLELSNVSPVPGGPHLDTSWQVVGPDGAELASIEEGVEVPDERYEEPPNEVFVTQGIDTSVFENLTSGEYTTHVTLTDNGSDETVEASESFRLEVFEFDSVVFTDGEPSGFEEYEKKPDATYERGEDVWLYLGVRNTPVDGAGTATLEYTFDVETPAGDRWDRITRTEEWERVQDDEILVIFEPFRTFEDDPPGEYEMTITVEDQAHDNRLETAETFTLE